MNVTTTEMKYTNNHPTLGNMCTLSDCSMWCLHPIFMRIYLPAPIILSFASCLTAYELESHCTDNCYPWNLTVNSFTIEVSQQISWWPRMTARLVTERSDLSSSTKWETSRQAWKRLIITTMHSCLKLIPKAENMTLIDIWYTVHRTVEQINYTADPKYVKTWYDCIKNNDKIDAGINLPSELVTTC